MQPQPVFFVQQCSSVSTSIDCSANISTALYHAHVISLLSAMGCERTNRATVSRCYDVQVTFKSFFQSQEQS